MYAGWLVAALVVAVAAQGCADLPAVQAGVCGNGVVDPGEDCDSLAPSDTCFAAGQANGCRFSCEKAGCPSGWGCGLDKVCRVGSGSFERLGPPMEAAEGRPVLADLDGDQIPDLLVGGRPDLLGERATRVLFLDKTGAPVQQSLLSIPEPAVAELTGDGRADLAFGHETGLQVLVGQADRSLSPILYPSLSTEAGAFELKVLPVQFRLGTHSLRWCLPEEDGGKLSELGRFTDLCGLLKGGLSSIPKEEKAKVEEVLDFFDSLSALEPEKRLGAVLLSGQTLSFGIDPRGEITGTPVSPDCQEKAAPNINSLKILFSIDFSLFPNFNPDPMLMQVIVSNIIVGGANSTSFGGVCDRIYIPLIGTRAVLAVRPCDPVFSENAEEKILPGGVEWRLPGQPQNPLFPRTEVITVPEGAVVTGGLMLADVNGDGFDDLLTSVARKKKDDAVFQEYAVSYGAFDGSHSSSKKKLVADNMADYPGWKRVSLDDELSDPARCTDAGGQPVNYGGQSICSVPFDRILATGFLDDQKGVEIVDPMGVWGVKTLPMQPPGQEQFPDFDTLYVPIVANLVRRWDEAVVSDVNRDGRLDVVAISSNSAAVDVLLSAGNSQFTQKTLSAGSRISQLRVGDINGDQIPDLVFKEKGPLPDTDPDAFQKSDAQDPLLLGDSLMASFSSSSGFPSEPRRLGRPGIIDQLFVSPLRSPVDISTDAIQDIGIVAKSVDYKQVRLTLMYSGSSAQYFSPYGLGSEECKLLPFPAQAVVGKFNQDEFPDLSVLTIDSLDSELVSPLRVWTVLGAGKGNLGARDFGKASVGHFPVQFTETLRREIAVQNDDDAIFSQGLSFLGAKVVAADLDKDGIDEVIVLVPSKEGAPCANLPDVTEPFVCRSSLLVFKAAPTGQGVAMSESARVTLEMPSLLAGRMIAEDLDGDGFVDLLFGSGLPADVNLETQAGRPDPVNSRNELHVIWNSGGSLASPPVRLLPEASTVRDFALINVDQTPEKELLVSTPDDTWLLRRSGRSFSAEKLRQLPGGSGLAAGDVDGDGVSDVVLMRGVQAQIYRVAPVR